MKKLHITAPKPTFDNPNDRKILFLLSHKEKLTYSEKIELKKLSKTYPDNYVFNQILVRELSALHFIESEDLEPNKTEHSSSGERIKHSFRWYTSDRGIKALRNNRFLSERTQVIKEAQLLALRWVSILVGIIVGLIGILSFFFKDFIDIMNGLFH